MHLIEPCCTPKHLLALRSKLGNDGTALFHGYGDLSLNELLPAMLTRYSNTEITIAVPHIPDATAALLDYWLRKQRTSADGKGKINTIKRLNLIADLREKRSPKASGWLKENPYGEQLNVHNIQQNDTVILLPDIAFIGPINLTYGGHFTALATKNARIIGSLRSNIAHLLR